MILPLVIEEIILKNINELIHINNFNRYKNELIRYFFNCDSICENCDQNICNKIHKELIQNEILNRNELCNGCDTDFCEDCEDKMHECKICGDVGMYEEDYVFFDGPMINDCYECGQDICEICYDCVCDHFSSSSFCSSCKTILL
tara:strand:- start:1467 stop:1901 length:435 start_codon:yes stop_codon:yes gene_type:complete